MNRFGGPGYAGRTVSGFRGLITLVQPGLNRLNGLDQPQNGLTTADHG